MENLETIDQWKTEKLPTNGKIKLFNRVLKIPMISYLKLFKTYETFPSRFGNFSRKKLRVFLIVLLTGEV